MPGPVTQPLQIHRSCNALRAWFQASPFLTIHWTPFLTLAGLLLLPAAVTYAGSWEIGYSFPAPTSQTNGLTWDGRTLWHTNDLSPIVYQINPLGGEVLGTLSTSVPDQGDLEFGGNFLWIVSENDHFLHKVNPSTGKTVDSILILGLPPGTIRRNGVNSVQMEGCTYDGRNVWVDGGSNLIIRIDPVTKKQFMYEMPFELGYLDGMAWAFDNLWVVTNFAVIYEIDACSMEVLDSFAAPANVSAGPEGFAFDGESLWFADNDLDRIYKIVLKFRIQTKRAAERNSLAKSAACNMGTELTGPVGISHFHKNRSLRPAIRNANENGHRAFFDSKGRRLSQVRPNQITPLKASITESP